MVCLFGHSDVSRQHHEHRHSCCSNGTGSCCAHKSSQGKGAALSSDRDGHCSCQLSCGAPVARVASDVVLQPQMAAAILSEAPNYRVFRAIVSEPAIPGSDSSPPRANCYLPDFGRAPPVA